MVTELSTDPLLGPGPWKSASARKKAANKVRGLLKTSKGTTGLQKGKKLSEACILVDLVLYGKLEAHLQSLSDQVRGEETGLFPKKLQVYVPTALSEYKRYLSMYFTWEARGSRKLPGLLPLAFIDPGSPVRPSWGDRKKITN